MSWKIKIGLFLNLCHVRENKDMCASRSASYHSKQGYVFLDLCHVIANKDRCVSTCVISGQITKGMCSRSVSCQGK